MSSKPKSKQLVINCGGCEKGDDAIRSPELFFFFVRRRGRKEGAEANVRSPWNELARSLAAACVRASRRRTNKRPTSDKARRGGACRSDDVTPVVS